jgi:hypothetical protein
MAITLFFTIRVIVLQNVLVSYCQAEQREDVPWCSRRWDETVSELRQLTDYFLSPDDIMSMETDIDRKTPINWEKNLAKCYFVHNLSCSLNSFFSLIFVAKYKKGLRYSKRRPLGRGSVPRRAGMLLLPYRYQRLTWSKVNGTCESDNSPAPVVVDRL